MFTGIIESIGIIENISKGANSSVLHIKPVSSHILEDTKIGDSIATNGVCLTVTSKDSSKFTADVMSETMRVTSLSKLTIGDKVNIERALALKDRLGGHIVSGHIDGIGHILEIKKEDISTWITIKSDKKILKYIIMRGSITIDGISLTVAELVDDCFKVSIIPHTASGTTLLSKKIGDIVNLENDVIAKYVEKLLLCREDSNDDSIIVTEQFLIENGFR